MALLNYTTTIDPLKSAGEIEYVLVKHGARSVLKNYINGHVESLNFIVSTPHGDLPIKLPINVQPVFEILKRQKKSGEMKKGSATVEQAERVAWRILKDWVEAQMAILETDMVKFEQIFLPYITDQNGRTLFEVMEKKQFLLGSGDTRA